MQHRTIPNNNINNNAANNPFNKLKLPLGKLLFALAYKCN